MKYISRGLALGISCNFSPHDVFDTVTTTIQPRVEVMEGKKIVSPKPKRSMFTVCFFTIKALFINLLNNGELNQLLLRRAILYIKKRFEL